MEQIETKERILTAAKREFAEKGFDGARMGAIAKKAKANQALIHYYFESKEKLYEQVLQRLFGIARKTSINNFLDKYNLTPSECLYMEIYFFVKIYLSPKDPDFERIISMQIGSGDIQKIVSIVGKFFIPQFQLLENTLRLGVEAGEFETRDIMLMGLELVRSVISYENFRKFFNNTPWLEHIYGEGYADRLFDFLIEHTFKGLRPSGKDFNIPVISGKLIEEANKTIDTIINEIRGGTDE